MTDNYTIKSEEEWKEILANNHQYYYPRNANKDAEETFLRILYYFQNSTKKPKFAINRPARIIKLENKLQQLKQTLQLTESLTNFERNNIMLDIKILEKKLGIKR